MTPQPEVFYDRSIRLWTILWLDAEGTQIGVAEYDVKKTVVRAMADRGWDAAVTEGRQNQSWQILDGANPWPRD